MTKRTKIIVVIIIAALIIIALGAYAASRRELAQSTQNQQVSNYTNNQPTAPPPGLGSNQTYQEFVKSGKSEVCTFATNVDNTFTTSTVYTAYGKIRTDFVVTYPQGGTAHQHLLVDSYIAYIWSNASSQGIKFAVEEASRNSQLNNIFRQNGSNFKCTEQSVDIKVFELPADVAFTDITGVK